MSVHSNRSGNRSAKRKALKPSGPAGFANLLVVNPGMTVASDFIDWPYFTNLGAVQCSSFLSALGHAVRLVDSFSLKPSDAFPVSPERFLVGCTHETLLQEVTQGAFDAVIVCLNVFHRPFIRQAAMADFFSLLRRRFPGTPLIVVEPYIGGMHSIDYGSEAFLADYPEVDFLVRGEPERELQRLIESLPDAAGTRVRMGDAGEIVLDDLPFPEWDAVSIRNYFRFLARFLASTGRFELFSEYAPFLPVITSRGCLFRCAFCGGTGGDPKPVYRCHSPEYISDYLRHLKTRYKIRGIVVLDSLANGHPKRFTTLLETIERLDLKVTFANGLRADLLRRKQIEILSRISPGVAVSAESAVSRVRNGLLNKALDLKAVEDAAGWCRTFSLPLQIHYMIGVPGETMVEVNATLEHAAGLAREQGAEPLVQFCVPLPGSALYSQCTINHSIRPLEDGSFSRFHDEPISCGAGPDPDTLKRMLSLFRAHRDAQGPEKLIVNLTYHCNNHCVMCAVGGRPVQHMAFETCTNLLDEYHARGVRMADFDGGEPTLHPDLLKILAYARRTGFQRISVTTNGRRLGERDFASRLLLSGITDLQITLYGDTRESHEGITRAPGSFEQTLEGLRLALQLKPGRIDLGVNTVITKSNYRNIENLISFVAALGVTKVNVQFPTPFGAALRKHNPPLKPACAAVAAAVQKHKGRVNVNILNLPPCLMPGEEAATLADVGKFKRHMAFVDTPAENLGVYLGRKRVRKKACRACLYYIVCDGFYEFQDAPPGARPGKTTSRRSPRKPGTQSGS